MLYRDTIVNQNTHRREICDRPYTLLYNVIWYLTLLLNVLSYDLEHNETGDKTMSKLFKSILYMLIFVSLYFVYISKTEQDKEAVVHYNAYKIYTQ